MELLLLIDTIYFEKREIQTSTLFIKNGITIDWPV